MNNAEKIRSLTDKELAVFLCSISPGDCWNCKAEKYCKNMDGKGMQEWIKQEVKEEDYWSEDEDDE